MTSFSLPSYTIVSAQKGVEQGVPVLGAILLARRRPTAGRWFIDVFERRHAEAFRRRRFRRDRCAHRSRLDIRLLGLGNTWVAAHVAFLVGYSFRVLAFWYAWEEPLAKEPAGVYLHADG